MMEKRDVRDTSVNSLPSALRNRKFKAGDLICRADPFSHVIAAKVNGEFCDWCAKPPLSSRLLKCGSCKYEHYCNKICQKKSWVYHKFECPLLKAIYPKVPPDSVRLMTKILWKLAKGVRVVDNDPQWREWDDLCTQTQIFETDVERRDALLKLIVTINAYVGTSKLRELGMKSGQDMIPELGRLSFNGYTLTSMSTQEIGACLYLSPSVFNHSCAPNAVHICDGVILTVRAIRDIDTSKEAIFVNYIDPMTPRAERQSSLLEDYCFTCQCIKCADEENDRNLESSICPACRGLVLRRETDDRQFFSCIQCKKEIHDSSYIQLVEESVRGGNKLVQAALQNASVGPKELNSFLDKTKNILSNINLTRTLVKSTLYAALSEQDRSREAYGLGEELTELFKLYYPVRYSTHGLHQWKQARLAWHLDLYSEAIKHYELAYSMMCITHGTEHSMTKMVIVDVDECKRDMQAC